MADTKARKRLKKLASSSSSSPEPDQDFIPKKSGTSITKESINKLVKSTETNKEFEDDSSLDDFITDKVEYDRYGPPVSSSESAHSTDEEGIARKIKRKRVSSPSEESASESSSISAKSFSETEEANESEEPKRILVGKQALEDKRARGLIPGAVKKIKSEKSEKKKKKEKKKEKKAEKYKEVLEKPKKEKKRDDGKKYIQFKEYSSREEREKAEIVTKIMCRWWYIAGDWPPANFDYSPVLKDKKLRLVPKESWSVEPVIYNDCEKVKEVPGYPGLFMNHQGKVFDLRPSETCPCFDYYFRKSKRELNGILLEALEKQLEVLNKQPKIDTDLQKDLRREIETYRKHA